METEFIQLLAGLDVEQHLLRPFELRLVKGFLRAFQFAVQFLLHPIRQIGRYLGLGAAQKERADSRAETPLGQHVAGLIKALDELGPIAQHAGHGEGHQTPEVEQPVLDGRAGERQPIIGL